MRIRPVSLDLMGCFLAVVSLATTPRAIPDQYKPARESAAPVQGPRPVKAYGSTNAPIIFEVFTDFQCPVCRKLYQETLRPMIKDYVASGKVYLSHRDYPIARPDHKYSGQAARWLTAAAEVGQFPAVEGALYDYQIPWEQDGDIKKYVAAAMPEADFKRVQKLMKGCEAPGPAGRPGAFVPSPHPCSLDAHIREDILMGNQLPVKATPTFVITYKGRRVASAAGYVSWPVLKQFFDNLLRQ
jgi:protein-disulfide isomerase